VTQTGSKLIFKLLYLQSGMKLVFNSLFKASKQTNWYNMERVSPSRRDRCFYIPKCIKLHSM